MNKQESDILNILVSEKFFNQRILSEVTGYSIGTINKALKNLTSNCMLDNNMCLTEKAYAELKIKAPKNAVILAAGFGMRMVPINTQTPKALLEVKGETLIERIIRQLREVGIEEIKIVVGFMKEQFEYLIDEYGVELIVNKTYCDFNNLHSLRCVDKYLDNTYIVPCDIWCEENPFRKSELYSWYMVTEKNSQESSVRVNRKMELVSADQKNTGNEMIGIAYLCGEDCVKVRNNLNSYCKQSKYDHAFWEETLWEGNRMMVSARIIQSQKVVEINTYEQLRELDHDSNNLKSDAISIISDTLLAKKDDIHNITVLKKGMTNRSFLFTCDEQKYIMRIPGEGTDMLINRKEEAAVYSVIKEKHICDDIIYMNPDNGYKITRFLENSRVCDPEDETDLRKCMARLKEFHQLHLEVDHNFDIFAQIEFYESIWNGAPSIYRDYKKTKEQVMELKTFIEKHVQNRCLTHIDAVPDNFLFTEKGDIRLIDWEYAGMQDPHVDIAMFCIYALYERSQVDHLIDLYFEGACTKENRYKIYCYIAACGLLWSNWCEYKRSLGVEFGEYSLRQYRYAKEYYKIFKEEYNESR